MKTIVMKQDFFRILQLTDIHLMNLPEDNQTFQLIDEMILSNSPELIVITGDLTMVNDNQSLLYQLARFMDSYHIPWTFVFGNHDYESRLSLDEQAEILLQSKYCYFEKGNPTLRGLGNYYISVEYKQKSIAFLGFLDSHNSRTDVINGNSIWSYDYLDIEQIQDAKENLLLAKNENPDISGIFFFHIPLVEFGQVLIDNKDSISGSCYEQVTSSKYNTGFFAELITTNCLKGIFVGHDHVNDYSFIKDNCLLAFGRCTGHYNYTMPEFKKGGRIIDVSCTGEVSSFVIIEK